MGRFLAIFGTLWVISICWKEILLGAFLILSVNSASRGIHDAAEAVGLAQPVPGQITVATQPHIVDRIDVGLTLTNMFPHEVYANVAVCAFHGPVYHNVSEQYWYGPDNLNRSAADYVGDRQVIITLFLLNHDDMPLPPYENGILDSTYANQIRYVPMHASEVLVSTDTVVWCKFASNFKQLADMAPNLVDWQGNVISQPHVTWEKIGPGYGVPLEDTLNLDYDQRHIKDEFDDFIQASGNR